MTALLCVDYLVVPSSGSLYRASSFINRRGICLGRQTECHTGHFNRVQLVLKEQRGARGAHKLNSKLSVSALISLKKKKQHKSTANRGVKKCKEEQNGSKLFMTNVFINFLFTPVNVATILYDYISKALLVLLKTK